MFINVYIDQHSKATGLVGGLGNVHCSVVTTDEDRIRMLYLNKREHDFKRKKIAYLPSAKANDIPQQNLNSPQSAN